MPNNHQIVYIWNIRNDVIAAPESGLWTCHLLTMAYTWRVYFFNTYISCCFSYYNSFIESFSSSLSSLQKWNCSFCASLYVESIVLASQNHGFSVLPLYIIRCIWCRGNLFLYFHLCYIHFVSFAIIWCFFFFISFIVFVFFSPSSFPSFVFVVVFIIVKVLYIYTERKWSFVKF